MNNKITFNEMVDHLSNGEILEDLMGCLDLDLETGLDECIQEIMGAMSCGYLPILQKKFMSIHENDYELMGRIVQADCEKRELDQQELDAWSASEYE